MIVYYIIYFQVIYENLGLSEENKLLLALNSSELKMIIFQYKKTGDIKYNDFNFIEGLKEQSTVEMNIINILEQKKLIIKLLENVLIIIMIQLIKFIMKLVDVENTGPGSVYFIKINQQQWVMKHMYI